jgi:hypothetical protein
VTSCLLLLTSNSLLPPTFRSGATLPTSMMPSNREQRMTQMHYF